MVKTDEQICNIPSQDQFTTQKISVIDNCLLGEYIDDRYVISQSVANELIACKKIKKATFRNSVFSSCYKPEYGEIVFEVVYEKNTATNTAKATIYVLENEFKVNGYLQNTIKTALSSYTDSMEGFIEKSYSKFNINISNSTGEGKEYKNTNDPNLDGYIVAKKQFLLNVGKLTSDKYMSLYKEFFEERLKLIKRLNNEFTNSVLKKFNLEYQKIEKYFLQTKDYKALSELLDKCFEDLYGVNPQLLDQEKEYREKILPIIILFSQKATNIFANAAPKALDTLNTVDKSKVNKIRKELNEYQNTMVENKKLSTEKTASENKVKSLMEELNKIKSGLNKETPKSSKSDIAAEKPTAFNEKAKIVNTTIKNQIQTNQQTQYKDINEELLENKKPDVKLEKKTVASIER